MLHVGCNSSHRFLAPILGDGSFKFVPIPEDIPSEESWTYEHLGLREILTDAWSWGNYAHYDPEFLSFTWGDYENIRTLRARQLRPKDFYFFMSSLKYKPDGAERLPDIDPDWAYYLIGFFEVAETPITVHHPIPEHIRERFPNNAHIRRDPAHHGRPFLIFTGTKTGEKKSRLLPKAVALSRQRIPNELSIAALPWLNPSNPRWWQAGIVPDEGVRLLLKAAGVRL